MATVGTALGAGEILVNVFRGDRKPFTSPPDVLIRVRDGNQKEIKADWYSGPSVQFTNLTVFDNFGDNYTVIASAKACAQAGFTPIKVGRGIARRVDLMLVPRDAGFTFAKWATLKDRHPAIRKLLQSSANYDDLRENHSNELATFFNLATTLEPIRLATGNPLDHVREMIELRRDRFFAYADSELIEKVHDAAQNGGFESEPGAPIVHPGATRSYKQVEFGEANVQITFHENDVKDGLVKTEFDMDYYRDKGSHALLEVIPNTLFRRKTDPARVYVLRWIAGRQAGVPEFDPPYVLS